MRRETRRLFGTRHYNNSVGSSQAMGDCMQARTGPRLMGLCLLALTACALLGGAPRAGAQGAAATAAGGHVILIAQLTVKAGREQDFIKLVAQMKERVRQQDHGNIRYQLFAVAPPPGAAAGSNGRQFVFFEEWQDQAAAAAHGKWAGPIVRTQWRAMSDSLQFERVSPVPLQPGG
jgi:quinol monooxygenase YgiN